MSSALLRKALGPLEGYLQRRDLVELCINQPGEVWLETGKGWQRKRDERVTLQACYDLAGQLATYSGQVFDSHTQPILSTSIPGYGCRIQICGGSVIDSGIAVSIRAGVAKRFPLENYLSSAQADDLRRAVYRGQSVVVAGGTSSGKTTFLNSLIAEIPTDFRLVVIEDSKELHVEHDNVARFVKSKSGTDVAGVTFEQIVNATMRLRPDRILLGELDIRNTSSFLRLMNTGHSGGLTTVHADSPEAAIDAIKLNTELSGLSGPTERYARRGIDWIVHLTRHSRTEFEAVMERIDDE